MNVLETPRLALRELAPADAAFILELLNEPAWLRFIGDKQVRSLADAESYIRKGPMASYARHGFGLWLTVRKNDNAPVGICGLLKRDALDDVDLGFALLQRFHRLGYATECAGATLAHARDAVGLQRLVAITVPDNTASIRVLENLGLRFEKMIRLTPAAEELKLFAIRF